MCDVVSRLHIISFIGIASVFCLTTFFAYKTDHDNVKFCCNDVARCFKHHDCPGLLSGGRYVQEKDAFNSTDHLIWRSDGCDLTVYNRQ